MNTFIEYDKINEHMKMSKALHYLNIKGKIILNKLENTKHIRKKKSGSFVFTDDVGSVYNIIVEITNIKRFNKLRLYFCMQYYMDELLFKEVKSLNGFQIEDDEYTLADMYFNQNLWNPLCEDDVETYNFKNAEKDFSSDEAQFLKFYFNEYAEYISNIKTYLEKFGHIDYIKNKLTRIFNRISNKITLVNTIITRSAVPAKK